MQSLLVLLERTSPNTGGSSPFLTCERWISLLDLGHTALFELLSVTIVRPMNMAEVKKLRNRSLEAHACAAARDNVV